MKDIKRLKGELACAECRRLKIRCDRTIPCSSCQKRGCAALCPNNTIPPGEGSRFVVAAEDHLSKQLSKLQARMRALEDAIAVLHSTESDQPHPLLTTPFNQGDVEQSRTIPEESARDASYSPGGGHSLGAKAAADVQFFGPTGSTETLLLKAKELEPSTPLGTTTTLRKELDPSYFPPEILLYYHSFPFKPVNASSSAPVQSQIESFLPPRDRALLLCETYLEHLSWMTQIVSRRYLVVELLPAVYRERPARYGPHELALLLMILALGALLDLDQEPYNLEAQHYYFLARAAAALQQVLAEQSMSTIKVLHLMSIYNGMSGSENNIQQSHILLNFASQVAIGIGFHIDPSAWGFRGQETYDRRCYFWNLLAGLMWQSMITGRPPVFFQGHFDCKIPSEEEEELYQRGEVPVGFGVSGFRVTEELLMPLAQTILAAEPPKYSQIMEMDAKIRNFVFYRSDGRPNSERVAISMRSFVRSHYTDLMLLFLHRGHFALAMEHPSGNPMESPFSSSILSAYRSACVVLEDTRETYLKKPSLTVRVWMIWSFAFSAAVVVGAVAVRLPHLQVEPSPLVQFEVACTLFQAAAQVSSRAARALPVLLNMLHKARAVAKTGHALKTEEFDSFHREVTASFGVPSFHHESIQPQASLDNSLSPQHDWGVYTHISDSISAPTPPNYSSEEGKRLDDRWASFMHNYGIHHPIDRL